MGIFTKKDTNTISGENKYKGWGNTKTKVFENERQQAAVMAGAGGDLSGKDFRQYKRDVHQQKRLNERALRRADRKGIDPSEVQMRKGEYKELSRREQDVQQYFQDVRKERLENTGEIALTVAAIAATGGLAAGALAPTATTAATTTAAATTTTAATGATAGTAATTTAATTAATEGGRQIFKGFGKRAARKAAESVVDQGVDALVNKGVDVLANQGTQGAMQPDPRLAQLEAQMQQLQQDYQLPDSMPTYQSPEFVGPTRYTASDVYDPLLGSYENAYNDWMNSQ